MLYLRTMGRLSLHAEGAGGVVRLEDSRALVVLAYLALAPKRCARRDFIAELLWPRSDQSRARQSLRQSLYYLARRAGTTPVRSDNGTLRLDGEGLQCDVWEFDRAMAEEEFERAVLLHGGGFLQSQERRLGSELQQWLESQNDRIRLCLRLAHTRLIEAAIAAENADDAVRLARRYAQLDPLDDTAQVTLIHALRAAGDDAGALQSYETYRTLLREAIGDRPAPELEEVLAQLRREMLAEPEWGPLAPAGLVAPPAVMATPPCPLPPAATSGASSAATSGVSSAATSKEKDETEGASTRTGRVPPRRRRAGWRAAAIVLGLIALIGTGLLGVSLRSRMLHTLRASAATTSPDLRGKLWAEPAGGGSLVEIRLEGADLRTSRLGRTPNGYWTLSPDGSRVADIAMGPHGYDLTLASPPGAKPHITLSAPADETPLGWSPDGRQLLYLVGQSVPENTGYAQRLEIYVPARSVSRPLTVLNGDHGAFAAWSPDGTGIAYVDAEPSGTEDSWTLWWIEAGGGGRRRIASNVAPAPPTWSPDSDRLAYAAWSSGSLDLYEVGLGDPEPHALIDSPAEERDPVWLSESWIVFLRGSRESGRLRAVNRRTGELRSLETDIGLRSLRRAVPATRPPWIERLEAQMPFRRVTPGLTLVPNVQAFAADGTLLEGAASGVSWRVSNPRVAVANGDGTLRIVGVGQTKLVADLRGWRADSLTLVSVPLEVEPLAPALVEDWTRGIRDDVWELVGDPKPYARPSGGPENGGVFVSNGDATYASLAATRRRYGTGKGLTIEAWGRMPFSGRHFEGYDLSLLRRPAKGRLAAPSLDIRLRYYVHGKTETAFLAGGGRVISLPYPDNPDAWHLYALQVEADGTVCVIIDGQLVWQEPHLLPPDEARGSTVAIGDRSLGVEIQHGPLRIYEGAKYHLPGPEER